MKFNTEAKFSLKQVTSHGLMCCIWTIQTAIQCIWFSFSASQSVTSGCRRRRIGWSYYDWIHKFLRDSLSWCQGWRDASRLFRLQRGYNCLLHDIPPGYLPSLSIQFCLQNASLYLSSCIYPFFSFHSPSSVCVFSHCPCPFLCHVNVPLFTLRHSPLPICPVYLSSFSTPLLTG